MSPDPSPSAQQNIIRLFVYSIDTQRQVFIMNTHSEVNGEGEKLLNKISHIHKQ